MRTIALALTVFTIQHLSSQNIHQATPVDSDTPSMESSATISDGPIRLEWLSSASSSESEGVLRSVERAHQQIETMSGGCAFQSIQEEYVQECFSSAGINYPLVGVSALFEGDCDLIQLCVVFANGFTDCAVLNLSSGGVFEFLPTPNTEYNFYFASGNSQTPLFTATYDECPEGVPGCTNSYAENYNGQATTEDGSCVGPDLCDCSGSRHTFGVQSYLFDDFQESGTSLFEGQLVDFNCPEWGYECGDIPGAPNVDPYGVCFGGFPPNRGCEDSCEGDLDGDGVIGINDFIIFNSQFGGSCD